MYPKYLNGAVGLMPFKRHSTSLPIKNAINSRLNGSIHFLYERIVSVALVPCLGYALIKGQSNLNDFALGLLVPVHLHFGMSSIITDYVPERKFKIIYKVSKWALRFGTALAVYAGYNLNTKDVGVTEAFSLLLN